MLRTVAGELGETHVLLDSGGADSTSRSFAMSYDVAKGGRADAIRVSVAQGTPGRFALDMTTGEDDFPAGQWHRFRELNGLGRWFPDRSAVVC